VAIRGAPSARRRLLSGETNLAALFHFLSKIEHGFLCDVAPFAARKRGFGIIEGCQEFRSLALALFPQQQCLLYRILGTVKPAGLDGLANECLLVGRQTYFHAPKRKRLRSKCQAFPAEKRRSPMHCREVAQLSTLTESVRALLSGLAKHDLRALKKAADEDSQFSGRASIRYIYGRVDESRT
jgi:hypothetical protein